MEYHPALATKQSREVVELADRYAEELLAMRDTLIKGIERAVVPFKFQLSAQDQGLEVTGDEVAVMIAVRILKQIAAVLRDKGVVDPPLFETTTSTIVENIVTAELPFRLKGLIRPLRPMSLSQVVFVKALLLNQHKLILGIGPAGTGKTHLAIAIALNQLAELRVKRVIITRPHVLSEGEELTSATLKEIEYDEQFTVFEDIIHGLIGPEEFKRLVAQHMLEITPLGRLRGRTFNDAFLIVDEAQNMSIPKMRMAVTRIGKNSRMVITGDPAQIDLRGNESGLPHFLKIIQGSDVAFVHRFENQEIIREEIVARIEALYASEGRGDIAAAA